MFANTEHCGSAVFFRRLVCFAFQLGVQPHMFSTRWMRNRGAWLAEPCRLLQACLLAQRVWRLVLNSTTKSGFVNSSLCLDGHHIIDPNQTKPNQMNLNKPNNPNNPIQTMYQHKKAVCTGGAVTTASLAVPAWYASWKMAGICKPAAPLVATVAVASILTTTSAYLYSQRCPVYRRDSIVGTGGWLSSSGVFCLSTWRATQHLRQAFSTQSWRSAGTAMSSIACMFVGATCMSAFFEI